MLVNFCHSIFLLMTLISILMLQIQLNCKKIMNRELRHVKKWLEANILALKVEKTNSVIFHSPVKKITEPIIIKFGCKHVSRSDNVKLVGVLLDETLSWRSHLVELFIVRPSPKSKVVLQ